MGTIRSGKNIHHVFPKRHRNPCIKKHLETKLVDSRNHLAWHCLCKDAHPDTANRRIWAVLFVRGLQLTKAEKYARGVLLEGKTLEECYDYCVQNFLPTGAIAIRTPSQKCFTHIMGERQALPTI